MRSFTPFRSIKEVQSFPCKFCKKEQIHFDEDVLNDVGRPIPLSQNGKPHLCKRNPNLYGGQ